MPLSDEELIRELEIRLKERTIIQKEEQEMFNDLERVSNKLKQAEKLKSNFLSNIRNEINNPLSSVLGLSSIMLNSDGMDLIQIKRNAYLIHNEIFNLDFQMRNIFAAAEIEAGEVRPRLNNVNTRAVLDNVLTSFQYKAEQKQVRFDCQWTTQEEYFVSDPYILYVIFMNLVSNAIEYSPSNSRITITSAITAHGFEISFQDFGSGIEKVDYGRIFDRFQQLDNGSTKQHGGHGLGLSVTREFTEALDGRIQVESSRSAGSVFTIMLPVKSAGDNAKPGDNWDEVFFDNDQVL